jgi:hypothetical protein
VGWPYVCFVVSEAAVEVLSDGTSAVYAVCHVGKSTATGALEFGVRTANC